MTLKRTWLLFGIVALLSQASFGAIEPTVLPVRYGQYGGSVAVGPQNTLLAWIDYRLTEDLSHNIFGTRVGPLGETLDGDGVGLAGVVTGAAAVAALGDQFLIVWAKGPNIYAQRMNSAGERLDQQPIKVSENPAHPYPDLVYLELSAAADGNNFWVAWTDDRSMPAGTPEHLRYQYQDIYAARINRAGRVLDPRGIKVCARGGNQSTPRLSSRADFIVWKDYRNGKALVFGARLNPKALVLDFGGFPIASSTDQYTTAADVSGNGRGWLAVWGESSGIYGAQIHRTRAVSRPFMIATTNAFTEPAGSRSAAPQVETSGQDCLVLWQSGGSTVGTRVTSAKRVSRIVTLATDPTGAVFYSFASFAGNGSRFWVTGTTAPVSGSWFYNDVWFGALDARMLP
ncbi:MAG TPA: hypothetical protein VFC26_11610 [Verrucomicrobiae bacterium]|nr:hypothetical protein [Verrucomicrobiae bacterium]